MCDYSVKIGWSGAYRCVTTMPRWWEIQLLLHINLDVIIWSYHIKRIIQEGETFKTIARFLRNKYSSKFSSSVDGLMLRIMLNGLYLYSAASSPGNPKRSALYSHPSIHSSTHSHANGGKLYDSHSSVGAVWQRQSCHVPSHRTLWPPPAGKAGEVACPRTQWPRQT